MRDYYKQLQANKMDNLEEMDKFLEKHNLPRLNQEEIENIKRRITNPEIETVIKNLPTLSEFSSLVYRNARDSWALILYPEIGRAHV